MIRNKEEMTRIKREIRERLYTGGPKLEKEKLKDRNGTKIRVWAGLEIIIGEREVKFKTFNKDIEEIRKNGRQRYPRYINNESEQTDQVRKSTMIGNFKRIERTCSNLQLRKEAIQEEIEEQEAIGTEKEHIKWAINRAYKRKKKEGEDREE